MPTHDPPESPDLAAIQENEAQRVLELVQVMGDVPIDLLQLLISTDPQRLVEEVFRDEVHTQRS
jgi:hypothetical protein